MRPVLCSSGLWLWVQATAALTISSLSDDGGTVQVGRLVAVEWQDAVGSVNASIASAGQNTDVQTILPLGTDIKSPLVWTATKDFVGGSYYFELQDSSGNSPVKSSSFSIKAASDATSSAGSSSTTLQAAPTAGGMSTSSSSPFPTTYLPAPHLQTGGNYFPKSAKIGVAVCATIVGLAAIGICTFCFHRKRKRAMLRRRAREIAGGRGGVDGEEKTLPIATPFQSATRHPFALTTQDREEQMLRSASRNPLAMTTEDQEDHDLYDNAGTVLKPVPESPARPPQSAVSRQSRAESQHYQSPTALRLARSPLERPVILGTHELEQPLTGLIPELEAHKLPGELDSRMIYPSSTPESQAETLGSSGTRRTRTARDKVGSDHWTFLRESTATDFMEHDT